MAKAPSESDMTVKIKDVTKCKGNTTCGNISVLATDAADAIVKAKAKLYRYGVRTNATNLIVV